MLTDLCPAAAAASSQHNDKAEQKRRHGRVFPIFSTSYSASHVETGSGNGRNIDVIWSACAIYHCGFTVMPDSMSYNTTDAALVLQLSQCDDAAERKRIRGVLAQRRYRRRQKDARRSTDRPVQYAGVDLSQLTEVGPGALAGPSDSVAQLGEYEWPNDFDLAEEGLEERLGYTASDGVSNGRHELSSFASTNSETSALVSTRSSTQASPAHALTEQSAISLPELGLVKAHVIILRTLIASVGLHTDVSSIIWNAFAVSPLHQQDRDLRGLYILPENYQPTAIQLAIPHHPIFDLLPWPGVRDRLIQFLQLPQDARPRVMQDATENVVLKLKFDMLDAGGGVRVHGHNAFCPEMWEVGQKFFDSWWWAFDSKILRTINTLRKSRGVDSLRLKRDPTLHPPAAGG